MLDIWCHLLPSSVFLAWPMVTACRPLNLGWTFELGVHITQPPFNPPIHHFFPWTYTYTAPLTTSSMPTIPLHLSLLVFMFLTVGIHLWMLCILFLALVTHHRIHMMRQSETFNFLWYVVWALFWVHQRPWLMGLPLFVWQSLNMFMMWVINPPYSMSNKCPFKSHIAMQLTHLSDVSWTMEEDTCTWNQHSCPFLWDLCWNYLQQFVCNWNRGNDFEHQATPTAPEYQWPTWWQQQLTPKKCHFQTFASPHQSTSVISSSQQLFSLMWVV